MSLEDAFRSELGRQVEKLKEENREVHEAVIRKSNELMKIRMSLVTEVCPDCGMENTIEWNVVKQGYQAFCPNCGQPLMLCSECMVDKDFCDWSNDTCLCYRMVEKFWKNFEDVLFEEDKDGRLILSDDCRFMIGTREVVTFHSGTDREEIWHWFDNHHPKGIVHLLNEKEEKREQNR